MKKIIDSDEEQPVLTLKQRVFAVLEESGLGYPAARRVDRIIVALIVVNLLAVGLGTVAEYEARYGTWFLVVEAITVTAFTVEYLLRLWVADLHLTLRQAGPVRSRLRYAVQPTAIIDLLAIAPALVALFFPDLPFGTLVAFRLLRFLKLTRYSPGMRSLVNALASERRALLASAIVMIGLIVFAASLMHAIEGKLQPDKFGSLPAALYWAVTTITTVGYGDVVPITPLGKIVSGLAMITGFSLFALPVGIIATAFAREIHKRDFVVTWGMLARVPLFSELGAADIAAIMPLLHAQSVESGTVITTAGEPAHSMYFVVSGTVEVALPDQQIALGAGSYFGEIAVLKKARRSADVIALSDCSLLVLDAADFHHLIAQRPDIGRQIRNAGRRGKAEESVTPQGDITAGELETSDPAEPPEET
ncbi:MAG TPA: cyclic nucleotide-gated ion channel [Devosiaceae bacterium]